MPVGLAVALLFALANLVLVVLILIVNWSRARRRRTHASLVSRLRPLVVEFVDADDAIEPPSLTNAEAAVFAELLAVYGGALRGPAHDRVVAYYETSAMYDEELRRLRARRAWVRATAAFTLGDVGSTRSVPELLRALDDSSPDVRAAAARSLGRLGAIEAIEPMVSAGVEARVPTAVARLALFDIGSAALPRLMGLFDHDEPAVRSAAVELVGLLGGASDIEPVIDHLSDPAAPVRAATATALGRLGAGEARDALVVALDDRVPEVRAAAARALGQIGGRTAREALIPVARGDTFECARAAAEALRQIDPALVLRLADDEGAGPHLREAADRVAL